MSNYTKATNFAAKDSLPVGEANKKLKGVEIDNEFNAIANAISTKSDSNSPTFTGTPVAPTASAATNNTQIATTAFVQAQKASPALTGTPTAPTASAGTNTTQIATTAMVQSALGQSGIIDTAQLVNDSVTADKLANTAVTAGTYGDADNVPQITVDAQGRITGATEVAVTARTPVITTEQTLVSNTWTGTWTKLSFAKTLTNNNNVGYFRIYTKIGRSPTGSAFAYAYLSNDSSGSPYVQAYADLDNGDRNDAHATDTSLAYVFVNLTEDPSNSNNWAVWYRSAYSGEGPTMIVALTGYM